MVKILLNNPHVGTILKEEFLNEIGMSQNALVIAYDLYEAKRNIIDKISKIEPYNVGDSSDRAFKK